LVKSALVALPDELRRPIELAYLGGNTYQQVAEILREPEGTIKSRIRKGLGWLRANLTELDVDAAGVER
jgi:RNA polymerase sigma-70 factor (ECF subfamily)